LQESITLIAHDPAGSAEAVGTQYELLAGIAPLTPLALPRAGSVTPARKGPAGAPLTLRPQWRGDRPPPDLNDLPPIRRRLGVDLNPVDAADPEQAADGAEQRGAVLIGEPKRAPGPAPDHWHTTTHPGDRGEACRRAPCIVVVPDTPARDGRRVSGSSSRRRRSAAEQPALGLGTASRY
ncbi:MAG: DUF2332 family protein, partial [Solirubrobacteraceae bacterium]